MTAGAVLLLVPVHRGPQNQWQWEFLVAAFIYFIIFSSERKKSWVLGKFKQNVMQGKNEVQKEDNSKALFKQKRLKGILKPFSQRSTLDFFLWISVRGSHPRHSSGRKVKKHIWTLFAGIFFLILNLVLFLLQSEWPLHTPNSLPLYSCIIGSVS